MTPTNLIRALVAAAALSLAPTAARAAEALPTDPNPGRDSKLPTLDQQFGLDATSSKPVNGLAGLSAADLQKYVSSVQAVNLSVDFQTAQGAPTNIGDTSHWTIHHLGPLPIPVPNLMPKGVQIEGNSDVKLSASYSKKNGQSVATLDDLKIQAPAAHFGPFGLLSVQDAEIKSNGEIDLKLAKYLPTLTVSQITMDTDGDVHLHLKYLPDVYITPTGDVQIHVGPSWLHYTQTIGHVGVNLFAQWPPSLEDFLALGGAPADALAHEGSTKQSMPSTGGIVAALGGTGAVAKAIDSLAGTASFSLNATTEGTPLTLGGKTTSANAQVSVNGQASLKNGVLQTIGNNNTANVKVTVGALDASLPNGDSADLKNATATLGGHYQLTLPLADPTKKMTVDFAGNAGVTASGTNANLVLPKGAKVSVSSFNGSANASFDVKDGSAGPSFQLDGGSYSLGASGPIQVQKLGGISALDMDGSLASTGTVKIGPSGLAQLTGNLTGNETLENNVGLSLPNGTRTTLQKGSALDVSLSQIQGSMDVPLLAGKTGAPTFVSGSATGSIGVQGNVGPTAAKEDGLTVLAPGAAVDMTLTGSASATPSSVTGSGNVTGTATLTGPASVSGTLADGAKVKTSIASGSKVALSGTVTDGASGLGASGTATTVATLGATTISDQGYTVNAPSGSVDLSINGKAGEGGATATVTGTAGLGDGTTVTSAKLHSTLAGGANVSLNGNVTDGSSGLAANGTAKATVGIGATSFQQNGIAVTAPSGTLTLDASAKTGPGGPSGQFTADSTLASGTRIVDSKGPLGSTFSTTLTKGTSVGAAGTFAGPKIQGSLTGQVNAGDLQGSLGPVTANIPASAQIGVSAPFQATIGSSGTVARATAQATVPILVTLQSGTTVTVKIASVTGSITLDTTGSTIEVIAHAEVVNGKAYIQSLDDCTINIVLGQASAQALGLKLGFPINTRITVTGNAAFGKNNITASGTASIGPKGSSTSWFQFNW